MNILFSFGHAAVVAGMAGAGYYLGQHTGLDLLSVLFAGAGAVFYYFREVLQFKKKYGRSVFDPRYWNPQFQWDAGLPALVFLGVCIAYAARSTL